MERLLNKFGNIKNIVIADKKEFRKINGIGKKTVKKVKNVLEHNLFEEETVSLDVVKNTKHH
ncbi:hypothetical protein HYY70_03340 [Candidatus Woesearchaeota archaeon]|nr:hypothetical protein [Candidatus Woesearchaeota archaeon]